MRALSARTTRAFNVGAKIVVADNSGAKIVNLIAVKGGKGTRKRQVFAKE